MKNTTARDNSHTENESHVFRCSFDACEQRHAHHFHQRCGGVESKIRKHRIVDGIVENRHNEQILLHNVDTPEMKMEEWLTDWLTQT